MRINSAAQEVILKVVYYGPGMAGKTTNLTVIHDRVPSHAAGDLTMVDTHSERTLRFDLLALDAGDLNGHHVRLEFYTVPGQSYYAATRRAVLAGADGVVFVADSRREALDENIEAMNEMLGNIRHHGLPDDLPLVVQYNKQDLPTALKREQLEPLMNVRNWPSHAAVAVAGDGVMETMQQITALVIDRARRSSEIPAAMTAPASWLISCFRCQAMLEVPEARIGSVYACGICGSALEVVDPDRGLTRPPAAAAGAATASQQGSGAQRQTNRPPADDSVYGLQTVEHTPAGGALGIAGVTPTGSAPAGGTPFEIPGYDLVAPLDDTVQGRRFRVRERATGRSLRALILNPTLMRQPGYRENLESHVRMAGQVRHPYILPLAAFTQTKESAALFSIDPPDYEPLGLVLARRRALAPPHAMGIIRQVALALEEAARHGVVHGWLRPEVVLVSPDGNVLIDEFAVPKQHRFLLRELSGASAATEYYLAPEHLSDEARSDVRTDIFQLGALTFRMLTGEGLVTGYNAHEALHKVAANGARTLRSVQPGISRDLDAFCTRLVAAERKDRFQTYREVIDTLDKFGGGAKRQTLRLTQNIPANQPGTASQMRTGGTAQLRRGGTGQIRRGGTGQIRRGGTGPIPGGLGATAPGVPRRVTPLSTPAYGRAPQGGGSGTAVGLVVLVAVVFGGAIAYFVYNNPANRVTPPRQQPQVQPAPTPAPATTTTVAKPPASTTSDPARTPTWMTKGNTPPVTTVSPTPTPTPTPVPATSVKPPIPAAVDPAPAVSGEDRVQLVLRIGEAERAGRFKDALALCEQLPSAEERQARTLMVGQNHDRMKQDLGVKVAAAKSVATATALLQPLLDGQGLPGDEEWAKGLLAGTQARIGKTPGTAPTPAAIATPGNPAQPPAVPVAKIDLDRAAQVDGQVNQALANGQTALANQGLTTLDAATPEAGAIKRKLDLWNRRSEILGRVLSERQPKLRVPHPTTNEMWDIVGFQPGGVTVSSAAGSKTDLTWGQVTIKDLARVCAEAAAAPTSKGEEHALATVALLVAGDTVLASVQVKKAKGAIEPALGAELDAMIAMQRRRDAVELVAKAKEAARLGNAKVLNDAIDQLKKLDKSLQPLVAEDVARLEEMRGGGITPAPGAPAGPITSGTRDKDHVDFDVVDDLKAFEKHGNWQVTGGMAVNSGDGARLQRKDLSDVRALHLIFQPMNSRGSMIVDFRGVRLVVDFAASTYQAISREETLRSKPFAFLPKATCSLYFEVKTGSEVQIDVNNGADTLAIKGGDLTDNLTIACDSASVIALDEMTLSRGKPTASKEKQGELRKLGLEPLGGAYLDAPTIVLAKPMGMTSGIAMVVRDNIAGATFEAKGSGNLRIQLGSPNDRSGQWVDVPLGAIPTAFKVLWTGNQLTVADGAGNALGQVALTSKHTHFMIIALQEAVLMATPKLTYQ